MNLTEGESGVPELLCVGLLIVVAVVELEGQVVLGL